MWLYDSRPRPYKKRREVYIGNCASPHCTLLAIAEAPLEESPSQLSKRTISVLPWSIVLSTYPVRKAGLSEGYRKATPVRILCSQSGDGDRTERQQSLCVSNGGVRCQ